MGKPESEAQAELSWEREKKDILKVLGKIVIGQGKLWKSETLLQHNKRSDGKL